MNARLERKQMPEDPSGPESTLSEKSRKFRIALLKAANKAGAGHTGGSLSEIDILTALYFHVMNIDPSNPHWEDRDRFILSKGHASLGLYTVLASRGYFGISELDTFDQLVSLWALPC
jgi:transketolase